MRRARGGPGISGRRRAAAGGTGKARRLRNRPDGPGRQRGGQWAVKIETPTTRRGRGRPRQRRQNRMEARGKATPRTVDVRGRRERAAAVQRQQTAVRANRMQAVGGRGGGGDAGGRGAGPGDRGAARRNQDAGDPPSESAGRSAGLAAGQGRPKSGRRRRGRATTGRAASCGRPGFERLRRACGHSDQDAKDPLLGRPLERPAHGAGRPRTAAPEPLPAPGPGTARVPAHPSV